MMNWFKRLFCAHLNRDALASIMARSGPRYLYRCKDCNRYFTRPWNG